MAKDREKSPKNAGNGERAADGTFRKGNSYEFGPDRPPPKSPGRPVDLMRRVRNILLTEVKEGRLKADEAAEVYYNRMMDGEHKFFADFLDREDGKPTQAIQHSGEIKLTPLVMPVEEIPDDMRDDDMRDDDARDDRADDQ